MPLHRIVYCSELFYSNSVDAVELARAIAASSAPLNRMCRLTGSLVYAAGSFAQVLEGPLAALEATFERICCDNRHHNLKLLDFRRIPERQFEDWSMACLTEADMNEAGFRDMLDDVRASLKVSVPQALEKMLILLEAQVARG